MNFLRSNRLLISTLSPVHVGCGEDYVPTNYVIEDDTLYEFDAEGAMRAFNDSDRRELSAIVVPSNQGSLLEVQKLFYDRKAKLIPFFKRRVMAKKAISDFYCKKVGKAVSGHGNTAAMNKLEIERNFYNPVDGMPVIPGSSIKGAIRTALLDSVNGGRELQTEAGEWNDKESKRESKVLQQKLFQYEKFEKDPMRLIKVSDTCRAGQREPGTELCFAVNRRRHEPRPDKAGNVSFQSMAEQKGLYQVLECVPAGSSRIFESSLVIHELCGVRKREGDGSVPAASFQWELKQIIDKCNNFYLPKFRLELQELRARNFLDAAWGKAIDSLLPSLEDRLNTRMAFLLRVGRHSNAESVTLNGARWIKIMRGKGVKPIYKQEVTTWWLASPDVFSQEGLLPFGWVLVEVIPEDCTPEDYSELDTVLADTQVAYRKWLKLQTERASKLSLDRANAEVRYAEEARQRVEEVRQKEEEARAKIEAAALEAKMTPEQKELSFLRKMFEEERKKNIKNPGGNLGNKISQKLNDAKIWPESEREELAKLVEEFFEYIGWGNAEKKKDRKAKIVGLRTCSTP